jgi:hypothetical protein
VFNKVNFIFLLLERNNKDEFISFKLKEEQDMDFSREYLEYKSLKSFNRLKNNLKESEETEKVILNLSF